MTYVQAKQFAETAAIHASSVKESADDPAIEGLALAIEQLSKAVAELASQMHRDK
ncbi:hypothetical protein [Nocardia asiatica]|uniref:hypothetical protein n=1 Tax=Nocardia asiatica TaxID=209252 RepID=UPI002456BF05|nr:hypothetical protein [Nocardia asiatica]